MLFSTDNQPKIPNDNTGLRTCWYHGYIVREDGMVWSYGKNRFLNHHPTYKGYIKVSLVINGKQKGIFLHRILCICFVPNPENKPEVNHIDFNRVNNSLFNLEWVTAKENFRHNLKNGRGISFNYNPGKSRWNGRFDENDIRKIRYLSSQGYSNSRLSELWQTGKFNINSIVTKKTWKNVV